MEATRTEALKRLAAFMPRAGKTYAAERNHDRGAGRHGNVSCLSPYLRHGLLHEEEVVRAAIERHGPDAARKFIEEVCWRTYFKGWLELRPAIWERYRQAVRHEITLLESDRDLERRYSEAVEGRTGIACFDHWARELVETQYLHNHARMWFASIWIFTLRLPWVLGADFFLRHLRDGDAASNTLSWRWVGGLHTKGKHYLATSSNIMEFTQGRFPHTEGLVEDASPLEEAPLPAAAPLPDLPAVDPDQPTGLLITEDDCRGELVLKETGVTPLAIAGLAVPEARSRLPVAEPVRRFAHEAAADGLNRAAAGRQSPAVMVDAAAIPDWAERHGLRQIVMRYVPQGPARETIAAITPELEKRGIRWVEVRRPWDETFWPQATAGYFKLKKRIPEMLREFGMPA